MTVPRVTVAIPTWNRAELLREAIASVLAQTLQDFEIVVSDNASTDHTAEVIASFADERIVHLRNAENIGHRRNIDQALHAGRAPYVALLFDDDQMFPTNLEKKVAVLDAHPSVALVHSSFELRRPDGSTVGVFDMMDVPGDEPLVIESGREFIRRSFRGYPGRVWASTAVMRASVMDGVGTYERYAPADDVAMWLLVAQKGDVAFLREGLATHHVVPGWSTANGYQEIDDGRYIASYRTIEGIVSTQREFLRTDYAGSRLGAWRHYVNSKRFVHGALLVVCAREVRGRSFGEALPAVLDSFRHDRLTWVNPLYWAKAARLLVAGRCDPDGSSVAAPPAPPEAYDAAA